MCRSPTATRDETVNAYLARLRARDGSVKYAMINSNVYHEKDGKFGHTRCFTTEIGENAWKAPTQTARGGWRWARPGARRYGGRSAAGASGSMSRRRRSMGESGDLDEIGRI
jgi:hypothetical protein